MAFIQERDRPEVKRILEGVHEPVELVIFTEKTACQYCEETRQLLMEVAELSNRLTVIEYDLQEHRAEAEAFRVDKAPGIVIKTEMDYGVRYYGIPLGYEFGSLMEDIVDVSKGDAGFSPDQLEKIEAIRNPVHLQVFVTPTCPYCPAAVRNAHRMAIANPLIRADMIEATEFPGLSRKFGVRGVPRTMVNADFNIDGGLPDDVFINQVTEYIQTQTGATA